MFENDKTPYSRFLDETGFFSRVPPVIYGEIIRNMDPELAIDIPMMCVRHADILQLSDAQQADLHLLVAVNPDKTDIRREISFGEPRLGIRRHYKRYDFETEIQYSPVTRILLGMRIRVRQFREDGFDIIAPYIAGFPSADAVLDAYINLRMYHGSYPFRIDQLPGDHISFDLSERHMRDGVLGTQYRHVHLIGDYGVINSAKDVFRPDKDAGTG